MSEPEIIYCDCAYTRIIPEETKRGVLHVLDESGCSFRTVPDLCHLAAHNDPSLTEIAENGGAKILACYPRAVRWLFHSAGAPLRDADTEIFNLRETSPAAVAAGLGLPVAAHNAAGDNTGDAKIEPVAKATPPKTDAADPETPAVTTLRADIQERKPGQWKPWFPVIDFDRCTNCMQCLSFCLFDVYGVSASGEIEVRNQTKCKTDCPACSRVCPEAAIMFPKYRQSPINGAVVRDEDLEREKMKIDVSSLLGGDIYGMLRDRHARARSRFAKERDDGRALKERLRCLKELQAKLDIPDSALSSLPSLEAIREKAEAVKTADKISTTPIHHTRKNKP